MTVLVTLGILALILTPVCMSFYGWVKDVEDDVEKLKDRERK